VLSAVPEEEIWLQSQESPETRRAYRHDVRGFLAFHGIRDRAELHKVDRMAVVAWKRHLEREGLKPNSIRRKLAALSSLFTHLVDRHVVGMNPTRDIRRPRVSRKGGATPAFSPAEGTKLLDAPDEGTLLGLRDRAILAVGLQVGPRRSEIISLRVRDLYQDRRYDCLRFLLKGGTDNSVAIHPNAAQRIRDYLSAAGHGDDLDGPLFRPTRPGRDVRDPRRHLEPKVIDLIVKKYGRKIGRKRGYSAHSMRATFITTALENGASLEDVQRAAGHADPDTTKLYDRRGYNPEKSASFFANY
jgi:integrase/recombinase XerD